MNPPKYNVGDVVKYVGKKGSWRQNQIMIIYEVSIDSGQVEYSTDLGAWFTEKEFTLVRKADHASMKELLKAINDEQDYEEL